MATDGKLKAEMRNAERFEPWIPNDDLEDTFELEYPPGLGTTNGLKSYIRFETVKESVVDITGLLDAVNSIKENLVEVAKAAKTMFDGNATEEAKAAATEVINKTLGSVNILDVSSDGLGGALLSYIKSLATTDVQDIGDSMKDLKGTLGLDNSYKMPEGTGRVCELYMPEGIDFSDNISYGDDQFGVTGAMVEGAVNSEGKLDAIGALKGIAGVGISTASMLKSGGAGANAAASLALQRTAKRIPMVGEMLSSSAGMKAVQSMTRVINAPNSRVLFEGVGMRSFSFSFNLIAATPQQSIDIKKIVKFFRSEAYPDALTTAINDVNVEMGLRYPDRFIIDMMYNDKRVFTKLKPCYLTGISVKYNAEQNTMHSDGAPTKVDLTLSFKESLALNKKDIKDGF